MSVWFCIPSARPPEEANLVLAKWRERGYKIALFCDSSEDANAKVHDEWISGFYPGYAKAVNALVRRIMQIDPSVEWLVTGGDDTEPDPNHSAEEIAQHCRYHFWKAEYDRGPGAPPAILATNTILGAPADAPQSIEAVETFGVMQPTGDRFAGGSIDRICGSPWMGREFCLRVNGGIGPLWPEYKHMFVDEELQCVAQKLGVLWQRRDLIHLHHHFMRESDAINSNAVMRNCPSFLTEANSPEHWRKYQALFNERKAAGFPGHEPLCE